MALTDKVPMPAGINSGVTNAKQATMLAVLGNPRSSYDQTCQPLTNPALRTMVVVQSVGPFRVQGLLPAVQSLKAVMDDVAAKQPAVHAVLGTAGMLCARLVRGSTTSISNHSWGTAVDLTVDGVLEPQGDRLVQDGLARIFPIFNAHGWYWGAGFPVPDGMHFECGDELIRKFHAGGAFGPAGGVPAAGLLSLGDRGGEVASLQRKLNDENNAQLDVDGDFGRDTQAAVMAFQAAHGLRVDGVAGAETLGALGLT